MPKEILFLETKDFHFPKGSEANYAPALVKPCGLVGLKKDLAAITDQAPVIFTAGTELKNEELQEALSKLKTSSFCYYFSDAASSGNPFVTKVVEATTDAKRSMGVKNFLAKNSTIYSEAVFHAIGLGAKLDRCFPFAKKHLGTARAIKTWSAVNSLLQYALLELPGQGDAGTGERIDFQLGADDSLLAINLRFNCKNSKPEAFIADPFTEVSRTSADFFECRALPESRLEIILAFSLKEKFAQSFQCATRTPTVATEKPEDISEYTFKDFTGLSAETAAPNRVVKGFKKKFSDRIAEASPTAAASGSSAISADPISAESLTTIKGGAPSGPEVKTVVSGSATLTKTPDLLKLEETIKQKDDLIVKLNKEIEEIKDPMKRGVITSIKDTQADGLKDNIKRLEDEAVEAAAREKELMAVVDKAIQLKDDAMKRLKDTETKLRQATEANSSKAVQLEKQLEEAKRQNKELSKKITTLSGAKAA